MKITHQSLKEFIEIELTEGKVIDLDASLFESKLLDSMALLSLIVWLEDNGDLKILPEEVDYDNMDSVNKIIRFYESK